MQDLERGKRNIKYFAYVRKSSEQKEKQALSIPAQIERIQEVFGHLDIEFVSDEKSAFKPYNRPGFASIMERVHSGERTGLIAWHPDRLSRNEVDASSLTYAIRTGVIEDVLFATYNFENSPEGIWMLQMALSQSQYESAKKGKDVKRGEVAKCKMGWRPSKAPHGYVNYTDPSDNIKKIKQDDEKRATIERMFSLMLTGSYTPPQILKIATEEWGFRTRGGKKLARSGIYNLFTRRFYCGEFEYPIGSGNWYQGKHEPYITKAEFDKIQRILGREGRPRSKKHKHAYTGLIRCEHCGCMVTLEFKTRRFKNGTSRQYYLAHCTRKKRDITCTQPSIQVPHLEEQIIDILDRLYIPSRYHALAMKWMKLENKKENDSLKNVAESAHKAREALLKKKRGLIAMRANEELTSSEYLAERQEIDKELDALKMSLTENGTEHNWVTIAENMLLFVEKASEKFQNGSIVEKRQIFSTLGSNPTLNDKKLSISLRSCLIPLLFISESIRAQNRTFEPQKSVDVRGYFNDLRTVCPSVLPYWDDVRTFLMKTKDKFMFDFVQYWEKK